MKDLKVREKLKAIYQSGAVDELIKSIDNGEKSNQQIEKAVIIASMIQDTELKAVSEYSKQFVDMINAGSGYRNPAEWPYVICGMRLACRTLLQLPIDPPVRKHIKELNEQVKKCISSVCGYAQVDPKPEEDDA